jgi:hypothetical protein
MSEAEILKRLADFCAKRVKPTMEDLSRCVGCRVELLPTVSGAFALKCCGDCWGRIAKALDQASNSTEQSGQ